MIKSGAGGAPRPWTWSPATGRTGLHRTELDGWGRDAPAAFTEREGAVEQTSIYEDLAQQDFPRPQRRRGQDVSLNPTHNYRTHSSCQPARGYGAVLSPESDACPQRLGSEHNPDRGVDAGGKGSNDPRRVGPPGIHSLLPAARAPATSFRCNPSVRSGHRGHPPGVSSLRWHQE